MRISWLSAEEISAALSILTANDKAIDDHFQPEFVCPPASEGTPIADWPRVAEHVARACRVADVVNIVGLDAARKRFEASPFAIERAALVGAIDGVGAATLAEAIGVLSCGIDIYLFYGSFLDLMVALGPQDRASVLKAYEVFVDEYAAALADVPDGRDRIAAVRDGLGQVYVQAGAIESAEKLFEKRHDEDRGDVAVALTASRVFLGAGLANEAIRWLGIAEARALELRREDLGAKLRRTREALKRRLN